ncbi:MAG TPA: hypothetical protein VFH03_13420 [Actinoplanes sp.]|nr:hypothetical protein [Actinoplanes sp.]
MDDDFDIAAFITDRTRVHLGRRILHPKFRALLDAGLEVLDRGVQGGIENPFHFPSGDVVCSVASRYPPFRDAPAPAALTGLDQAVSLGPMPDRKSFDAASDFFGKSWHRIEDYRADLAMYALTMPAWSAGEEIASTALRQLIDRPQAVDAVLDHIACRDLRLFENCLFRVQLVMQAMAPDEDIIRAALDRMYATIDRMWTAVCQGLLDHYNARLRPDVSVLDITRMLTASAEGTGLRRLAQFDDNRIYDAVRERSVLGKAAFCFFAASIAPDGDSRTLAEFFRQSLVAQNPASAD